VYGLNVPSGVSNQPINEETIVGANNRISELIKFVNDNTMLSKIKFDVLISIENGLFYTDDQLSEHAIVYDRCVICKYTINTFSSTFNHQVRIAVQKVTYISQDSYLMPVQYASKSIKEYSQTITAGSLLEHNFGYTPGSWHQHVLENGSRKKQIFNTLESNDDVLF
jgi:non-canonical (house-cleaning) NTP pyrophosphatase